MPFLLVFIYHLLLLGALAIASGTLSGIEIAVAVVLIALGGAALIEASVMVEPKRRRRPAG